MNMPPQPSTDQSLRAEIAELRARLEEAEEMLHAIRAGEIDALVVEGSAGPRLFILQGLDADQNRVRGEMLEQVSDAVIALDTEERITFLNAAAERQYGVRSGKVLGLQLTKIFTQQWLSPATEAGMRTALSEHGAWRGELMHRRLDGSELHVESSVAVLDDPETGERTGSISAIRDVTERKRAEDEARRLAAALSDADRRKDLFLATLAHELRNPLAPMRNGLQIMKLTRNNGDAAEQVRAMMDRQLSQLVRLVDDLLDVSRINQGKVELRVERIDLKPVLATALEASRPAIEEAGHELTVVVPDAPIFVDGDAARLAQVVSNLLNNAAKYTHAGGHIRMTVWREDGMAMVAVKDNGIGIPPAMLDRVFEVFIQVDRALEKTTGGLGIGLSLVKGLLEMHGGTVEARSDGEGMGSEFVVRLPVVTSVVAGPERVSGQSIGVVPSAPRRILVVDDNVDAADSLGRLLEVSGNEVRTANDGEAGIAAAAQFRPDVVLMDIGMPKLNGYEAARRIRQHPWGRGMVLVALTGWGQDDDRKKSAGAGFDHHLVKPVEMDTLIKLMSSLKCPGDLDVSASAAALPSVGSP